MKKVAPKLFLPDRLAVLDEVRPLVRLHGEEDDAAEDGEDEEETELARLPCRMPASASTIVTLLQMSRKVMKAVSGMPRIVDGRGQFGSP